MRRLAELCLTLLACCACHDLMALGAFGEGEPAEPSLTTGGAMPNEVSNVDAGMAPGDSSDIDVGVLDGGSPLAFPACLASGVPGALNAPGTALGPTETLTDWSWPAPIDSLQWDFVVERDVAVRDPGARPTGGYYWSHVFNFEQGVAGRLGIQSEGVYQSDPPESEIEFTKMAVYWLSGPPIAAELGDIAYPDARVAPVSVAGTDWLTIHARFDWQVCHVYRMRVAPESADEDGNVWYGAWIDDTTLGVELLLGRMLLPADVGLLSPFSISRTTPIDFVPITECAVTVPVSALFGTPSAVDGLAATSHTNRFASSPRCGTSRFAEFPNAVRHELAVSP